jgi:hypothetical protein
LLGDEAAVIHLAGQRLLPLRRAVKLRPGPRTPELQAALARRTGAAAATAEATAEARASEPFPISDLFPSAPAGPADLRAVFFLDGFAERPTLTPIRLTVHDTHYIECLAANDIAYTSWGLAPERRALRLLALRQLLARLPCWVLKVGAPGDTAALIESTMEDLACSP